MAPFHDDSPFSDPDRRLQDEASPFPRWQRWLAEAQELLAWAPAEDPRHPGADPES
jgi:hypothetical protein